MKRLLDALKDSSWLTLFVTVIFFVGILLSAFFLYTLPQDLILRGGIASLEMASPIFSKLFIVIAFTFAAGIAAINIAIQSKKEVIVYLEKKKETLSEARQREESSQTIDLTTLKSNLDKLKQQSDLVQEGLNSICSYLQASQGICYLLQTKENKNYLKFHSGYALSKGDSSMLEFAVGEGLIGQCASSGQASFIEEVPEGYINASSGLGSSPPCFLLLLPLMKGEVVKGVVEVATFAPISATSRKRAEEMCKIISERVS